MSLLNLWSLFKSTLFLHLSLMDKIIVLAPPTKRKHPAPPPVLQQTSPAHFPRNERLVLLSQSERKTPISYNLQQTSPANERLLLLNKAKGTLGEEAKPRISALPYIQLLPHAALQQKSTAHCPKNECLLLLSNKAKKRN